MPWEKGGNHMADEINGFPKVVTSGSNRAGVWLYLFLGLLILTAQWGSVAVAETVTSENIAQRITDAKTPADHEAIAVFYRAQAAEADTKIKAHEKMKQSYRAFDKSSHYERWHRWYCDSLINSSRTTKNDYEALAEEHEHIAEALKGGK
jgi:hypothetical protein